MNVYLIDDEPLALRRLERLLSKHDVQVSGSSSSPTEALKVLNANPVDALFLDIQMPEMSGFELLTKLTRDIPVVFTTAFDQYALSAFEVNSIDYLLKPISDEALGRALKKLARLQGVDQHVRAFARQIVEGIRQPFPERIASRAGDRVLFVEVRHITHFYAKDKVTLAATAQKDYVIDATITELEQKLDPARFLRIHRSTLLNLNYIEEVNSWFAGGMMVRLKDGKRTELSVARDRVSQLKSRLEF